MLFVSRTCFNEFLSLLDVAWVNKVLYCIVSATKKKKKKCLVQKVPNGAVVFINDECDVGRSSKR